MTPALYLVFVLLGMPMEECWMPWITCPTSATVVATQHCYADGHCDPPENYTEPIDVPAIEEQHESGAYIVPCSDETPSERDERQKAGVSCTKPSYYTVTTCADKSRILLHSEDGHYWCHKVQQ